MVTKKYKWRTGSVAMVEHLPRMCKALVSIPSTTKKKKKEANCWVLWLVFFFWSKVKGIFPNELKVGPQ